MTCTPKPSQGPLYLCHYWYPGDMHNAAQWLTWGERPIESRAELVEVILTAFSFPPRPICAEELDVLLIEDGRVIDITEQAVEWANRQDAENMGVAAE